MCSFLLLSCAAAQVGTSAATPSRCALLLLPAADAIAKELPASLRMFHVPSICFILMPQCESSSRNLLSLVCCVPLCASFSCVLVVSCRGAEEEMPSRSGGKGMGQHKTIWQQKQPETRCCGAAASTARCGRWRAPPTKSHKNSLSRAYAPISCAYMEAPLPLCIKFQYSSCSFQPEPQKF